MLVSYWMWWDRKGIFKGGTECSGLKDWMDDNAIMVNTGYMKMYWG